MIIRNWVKGDNLAISQLEKVCFSSPWSLEMIESTFNLNNFVGFVCENDGQIIGYIGIIYDQWDGSVLNVAVRPEFRQQGVGSKLLNESINFLISKNLEQCFLEVRKSNLKAQRLYEKFNFKPIGERKKYYENTEDAIVMARVLKEV